MNVLETALVYAILIRATEDQQGAIREFVLGRDAFVGLPAVASHI